MITRLVLLLNIGLLTVKSTATSSGPHMDFHAMLASAKRAEKARSKTITTCDAAFEWSDLSFHDYRQHGVNFSKHVFKNHCSLLSILEAELDKGRSTPFEDVGGRRVWMIGGVPHPSGAILMELPPWVKKLADALRPAFDGEAPNQVLVNVYEVGMGILRHNDGPLYHSSAAILTVGGSALLEFTDNCKEVTNTTISATAAAAAATTTTTTTATTAGASSSSNKSSSSGAAQGATPTLTAAVTTTELPAFSVYLPANSLVVFTDSAYHRYDHEIQPRTDDIIDSGCINAAICGLSTQQTIPRTTRRFSLTFRRVKHVAKVLDSEFGVCSTEEQAEIDRRFLWWKRSITDRVT